MNTMNTKILFTDLDGTLLNDEKEITPGNLEAIRQALAAGHKIVIATGRPLASALLCAKRTGLTEKGCYAITYNGAQIVDIYHNRTIYGKTLSSGAAEQIYQEAVRRGIHIQSYSSTHVLSLKKNRELDAYVKGTGIPWQIVPDIASALREDQYKLLAIDFDDHEKLEQFREEVIHPFDSEVHGLFSNNAYLEIVSSGISKGFAVNWMCGYLGIPVENSVAAGDAQNDIEMLQAASVGAVMCNAFPGVSEHGDYVTKRDNNHDGLAEIIRRFILVN